jgi:hypothetical protein
MPHRLPISADGPLTDWNVGTGWIEQKTAIQVPDRVQMACENGLRIGHMPVRLSLHLPACAIFAHRERNRSWGKLDCETGMGGR